MKIQLIPLESHDDLISVKDRMSWAKAPRILLIWPKGEGVALRPLDLKILQRHARSLGATLGLVTRDPLARREAEALNLPVFDSPHAARADLWSVPARRIFPSSKRTDLRALRAEAHPGEPHWRGLSFFRVGFFALGVLAVLAIAALFLPRAEVTLSPESKIQILDIPVVADPALESVFISGNIPALQVTREIAESRQIPSTGEIAIPESEAVGVARFRNLSQSAHEIPPGTVVQSLSSPPIRFVTTRANHVSAGLGRTVDIPIVSVGAGSRGNLEVDSILAIEGPLGLALAVTNPVPTSGGTDSQVRAPSEADRERLRSILISFLRAQVQAAMQDDLPAGSLIFPASVQEMEVLEEAYDPPVGGTGDTLSLALRVKFSAQYASGEDLSELTALALSAVAEKGFSAAPEPFAFRPLGTPVTDEEGRTGFDLRVEQRILRMVDVGQLLALVQGRRVETAQARLANAFALSFPPQIKMSPRWWPWLPLAPFRINVVIQ